MKTMKERLIRRVRIKLGASIYQDFLFLRWPQCCPPIKEYEGEEYRYRTKNPLRVFDGEWNGEYWKCRSDGYGHLKSRGDAGDYGNGIIIVKGFDSVEIIDLNND